MMWLQQLKEILDGNPEVSDFELFRTFPALQGRPELLTAALLYWKYGIVAPEFEAPAVKKKETFWQKIVKYFKNGTGRIRS